MVLQYYSQDRMPEPVCVSISTLTCSIPLYNRCSLISTHICGDIAALSREFLQVGRLRISKLIWFDHQIWPSRLHLKGDVLWTLVGGPGAGIPFPCLGKHLILGVFLICNTKGYLAGRMGIFHCDFVSLPRCTWFQGWWCVLPFTENLSGIMERKSPKRTWFLGSDLSFS